MSDVKYVKITETDPLVVQLAEETKQSASSIAAMINQDRYRKAYNRIQQQRMKVVRRLVKEHPELLGEGGK